MKIAMVCPAYLPESSFGGPVFYVRNLARILTRNNHEVVIHTSRVAGAPNEDMIEGVQVVRHNIIANPVRQRITPNMYRRLTQENIDVIHTHGARNFQFAISVAVAAKRRLPLVLNSHGSITSALYPVAVSRSYRILHLMQTPMLRLSLKTVSRLVALNNFEYTHYQEYGVPEEKIFTLPLPIDLKEFQRAPYDFRAKHQLEGKIVLFVGRLTRLKGIDVLIRAYGQIIREMDQPVHLVLLVARDRPTEEIAITRNSDFADRLVLFDPSREDIISAYHSAEVVVVPSFYESFSTVILEAEACGKPVVASNVGGIPELVTDGVNGFLTQVGDVTSLSSALKKVLENDEDSEKMGENGKAMVQKYSLESLTIRLPDLYKGLLSR